MRRTGFNIILIIGLIFGFISSVKAAGPLWTFTPLTATTLQLPANDTAIIQYRITNQSNKPHTLVMKPMAGATQITAGLGVCDSTFSLRGKGDACTLSIEIDGHHFKDTAVEGPVVCEKNSNHQCYRPSATHILRVSVTEAEYTVRGTITGLQGTVALQMNNTDPLVISTDGNFVFPTTLTHGSSYNVVIHTQPNGETCNVSQGNGVINQAHVTDVVITCAANAYTVGGSISNLNGTVVLQNNGGDPLTLNANGTFTFSQPVAQGSPYQITVLTQPATQTCTVSGNGTGIMGGANVTNVTVTCATNTYTVGGTVSNLLGTLVLENNGADPLTLTSNGSFTFSTPIAQGSTYAVTVRTQPATRTCSVSNDSGTIGSSNVTNVSVTCSATNTTLSVSTHGTIPVNNGSGSITVTNTGANTAQNVAAVLPSGWTNVTQDASACTTLAPAQSCTLLFSSTTPYVAQRNIAVSGTNITAPLPRMALAFTLSGYYVFGVSGSTATVIDTADLAPVQWGEEVLTNANSFTDGFSNTAIIRSTVGIQTNAANNCYNNLSGGAVAGTWFLPAICQMSAAGQDAGCNPGLANIDTNLHQLGFGGLTSNLFYWSSTESLTFSSQTAWYAVFAPNNTSFQSTDLKENTPYSLRCVRTINF